MLRYLKMMFLMVAVAMFAAACSSANTNHGNDHDHSDHDEARSDIITVPNNGAVIRLVSPVNGATFTEGEEVVVSVEVENFVLGEDGNHWHIYVNDRTYAMVMGSNASDVVRGLEPGEHKISVYMSNADHADLEVGDAVLITVNP